MEKIKRFIECIIPVSACNLQCKYCYIIQQNDRKMKIPKLNYDPEWIGKALSKKRMGGVCFFNICGAGETLIPNYTIDIVKELLKQGHFVNITTNGTLNHRFDEIVKIDKKLLKRLNISFSFHYLELKRLNLLNDFFDNIDKIRKVGISFVLQLNLYDGYMPYVDDIKKISKERVGAYPQVALTRKEYNKEHILTKTEIFTEKSEEEYIKEGKKYDSPLFDFTTKNFNVKRKEFCYAGDWSGALNLITGDLKKCYAYPFRQNIFKDINKPINFEALGKNCNSPYCINSSHFMSLGVIPSIKTPTYRQLRDRPEAGWYASDEIKTAFDSKLIESNKEYGKLKKLKVNVKNRIIIVSTNMLRKLGIVKLMRKFGYRKNE